MALSNTPVDTKDKSPDLSVVVVTVYNSWYLKECLTSLENQIEAPNMEIVVVYHEGVNDLQLLKEKFCWINFYLAPGRQTQAKMLALGIRKTHSRIVALTVDHCAPAENWCSRIIELYNNKDYAAVGGALKIGIQPKTVINWAVHLYDYCSYGYYQHPITEGPALELSDCNIAYKREILDKMAHLWVKEGFHVPLINRYLRSNGELLWFSKDLLVFQNRSIKFRNAARIAYRRGKAFASVRLDHYVLAQRIVHIILSPILPIKLLLKFVRNITLKHSVWGFALLASPFIIVFALLWSLGEFVGFFKGQIGNVITVTEE